MLPINPDATFKVPVSITVPGKTEPAVIEIEYRHKGRKAYQVWWDSANGRSDVEVLGEAIVGWTGPIDEHGSSLAYTAENLALVLDRYPASALEILSAYRSGLLDSRAKN